MQDTMRYAEQDAVPKLDVLALWAALDRDRRLRRLTKRAVAEVLGVHPAVLGAWQWGDRVPATDSLVRMIIWLDADLRDFISSQPRP
ncbi:hypothetical protein [Actinomadura opuntiae]|uniref:hypothetical protein n=1 Tax=Actinomadura sp. OS1-43 TaxID=604315 RepID=UPI00255A9ABF|nr:hypothetical protein [Actinomadura sp. OS1-43]MDL4815984.1 hypothetical protein [Actinomadura sp. OS1-43]